MFAAEISGQFEPYRVRKLPAQKPAQQPATNGASEDIPMINGTDEEEPTHEEDPDSDVGAIWPLQAGRIVNWPCFFAFLEHVHRSLGANFHTPILIAAQPIWTPIEHVKLTRFVFEKFKCPAFALMDSAQALCYAYGAHSACVIDIGKDKADVTAVAEFLVSNTGRGIALPGLGGEAMTKNLMKELGDGFDREMCEQLKMSSICEILPAGTPLPGAVSVPTTDTQAANPASAVSTGADGSGANQRHTAGATGDAPRGPAAGTATGADEEADAEKEGVVDVAALVASGKLKEHLAKKEKERAAKAAARKKAKGAAVVAEELKNSDKEYATFLFEDHAAKDRAKDIAAEGSTNSGVNGGLKLDTEQVNGTSNSVPPSATIDSAPPTAVSTTVPTLPSGTPTTPTFPSSANDPAGPPNTVTTTKAPKNPHARTLTVGPARFLALPPDYLSTLGAHINAAIQQASSSPTIRQSIWDHILLTGNGARIHGFKEALLAYLHSKYIISPNSASIFTSEPPSSFGTPGGTGANTPMPVAQSSSGVPGQMSLPAFGGSGGGGGGAGGGVNPLLLAATTASASGQFNRPPPNQNPSNLMPTPSRPIPGSSSLQTPPPPGGGGGSSQRPLNAPGSAHSAQTPTSIKAGRLPEYFAEWKEEGSPYWAVFLGAQVAAKCLFLADDRVGVIYYCHSGSNVSPRLFLAFLVRSKLTCSRNDRAAHKRAS